MTLHSGGERPGSWSRSITFAAMWTPPPGWITLLPLLWPINRTSCIFQDQWKVNEENCEMKLCSYTLISPSRGSSWLWGTGTESRAMPQSSWVKTWRDVPGFVAKRGWNILAADEETKWRGVWQTPIFLWCLCQAMLRQAPKHRREIWGMISETRSESTRAADLFSPIKAEELLNVGSTETQNKRGFNTH